MPAQYLSIHEAASLLKVSTKTLRRWEAKGILLPERTEGGHRRYTAQQLNEYKEAKKKIHHQLQIQSSNDKFQIPEPSLSEIPNTPNVQSFTSALPELYSSLHFDQKRILKFAGASLVVAILLFSVARIVKPIISSHSLRDINPIANIFKIDDSTTQNYTQVLAEETTDYSDTQFSVNVPSVFAAASKFLSTLEVTGNITAKKDVTVAGDIAANGGYITTTADTFYLVNENATTLHLAEAGTSLSIAATTGTTTINNNLVGKGTLTVSGAGEFSSTLKASGATTLSSTLAVSGASTLSSSLAVSGATTLSSTLAVTGATTLSSTLAVTGVTTLTGNLDANGTSNDIAGTLNLSGDSLTSSTDLVIDATGGGVKIGVGTPGNVDLAGDDLYVVGDLEVDGTIYGGVAGALTPGFPEGTIVYTDAAGSLASDTDDFFWNATLDRIGIGTSNPTVEMDVVGSANFSGNVGLGNSASDTITFNGRLANNTSIVPDTDLGSDLGTAALRFDNLYVANINSNAAASFTGQVTFTYSPTDATLDQASVIINPVGPAANGQLLGFAVAGYEKAMMDVDGDLTLGYADAIDAPASANPLNIYNHGATRVAFVDTSGNQYLAGNLGIGITAPTSPLHIVSTATTGTVAQFTADSLTTGKILNLASTSTALSTGSLASLDWSPTGSTEIYATGDLLSINTGTYANVGNLLNIKDDGSSVFAVSQAAVTANVPVNFTSPGDLSVSYDIVMTNTSASYIKSNANLILQAGEVYNSSDLSLNTFNQGSVVVNQDNQPTAAGTSYALQVLPVLTSSTNSMTYTSQYGIYNYPTVNLTGDAATDLTTLYNSYASVNAVAGTIGSWYGYYVANAAGSGTITNKYAFASEGSAGNVGIGVTNPATLFQVNATGSTAFSVNSSGYVGIGTTAPANYLHIKETNAGQTTFLKFQNTGGSANDTADIDFVLSSSNVAMARVGAIRTDLPASAGTALTFSTHNGTSLSEKMRIDGNGYVGIGTTIPSAKLGVVGGVGIGSTDTGGYANAAIASYNMAVQGNIGVGVTSPTPALFVSGGVGIGNTSYNVTPPSNGLIVSGNVGVGTTSPNVQFQVNAAGSSAFAVTSSGYVGIGTTAPTIPFYISSAATTTTVAQLVSDSLTTGTAFDFSADALTTGKILNLASTSTVLSSGSLATLDWSPTGSTEIYATGDLLSINVGTYGNVGNLLNIKDDGSSVFSVSQAAITAAIPTNFTNAGDVGFANDINMTNESASYIKSANSLYLQAGENYNSSFLGLNTFNEGSVTITNSNNPTAAATSYVFQILPTITSSTNSMTYTSLYGSYLYPAVNLSGDAAVDLTTAYGNYTGLNAVAGTITNWYANYVAVPAGSGTVTNKYAFVSEDTAGNVGIGVTNPVAKMFVNGALGIGNTSYNVTPPTNGLIVSGNIGIGTTSPSYALDVNGTARLYQNIFGNGTLYTYMYIGNGDYHQKFYTRGTGGGAFERLRLEGGATSGNSYFQNTKLGIGTTIPGSTLSVVGGVGIGSTATGGYANASVAAYNLAVEGNIGIGATSPASALQISTTSGSTTPRLAIGSKRDAYWGMATSEATFNGTPDPVMFVGYNISGVGSRDSNTVPAVYLGLEQDYEYVEGSHVSEIYYEWYEPVSATSRRTFHTTFDYSTYDMINMISGATSFRNSDTTNLALTINDDDTGSVFFLPAEVRVNTDTRAFQIRNTSLEDYFVVNTQDSYTIVSGNMLVNSAAPVDGSAIMAISESSGAGSLSGAYITTKKSIASGTNYVTGIRSDVQLLANTNNSSSTVAYGVYGGITLTSSGSYTVSSQYGLALAAAAPALSGAGTETLTNAMGLYVYDQGVTGVANAYGIYLENQAGASTLNYALYSAGGQSYFGGNVGIGATSPVSSLSVGATSQFQVNSTGNIVKINDVVTSFPSAQGAVGSVLTNDGAGVLSWAGGSAEGPLGYLQRNGTVVSTATLTDKVGIGTTAAGTMFSVVGGVGIGSTAAGGYANAAIAAYNLAVEGNVGIGITNPGAKLEVGGDILLTSNSGSYRTISIADPGEYQGSTDLRISAGNPGGSVTALGGRLYLDPGNGSVVPGHILLGTLTTDTHVGIGTSFPTATLTIVGGVGIGTTDSFASASIANNNLAVQGSVGIGVTSPTGLVELGALSTDGAKGIVLTNSGALPPDVGMNTNVYSIYQTLTSNGAVSTTNRNVYGLYNSGTATAANGVNAIYGTYNSLTTASGAAGTAEVYGLYNKLVQGTGTKIEKLYGLYNDVTTGSGGTKTAYGSYYTTNTSSSGGTQYAYYGNMSAGTATKWGLYIAGETANTLSGKLGIGTTSPGSALSIVGGVGIGTTDSFANAAVPANTLAVQGKLGVGTSTPANSLQVTNTGQALTGKGLAIFDQYEAQDIIVASASGVTKFTVDATGQIYMGVNTTLATSTAVCWEAATVNGATLYKLGDCTGTPADLAEYYPSTALGTSPNEGLPEAGDVVSIADPIEYGSAHAFTVTKSSTEYDQKVLGIVSTKAYEIMGEDVLEWAETASPIALTGRVPVKIDPASSPIQPGDMLTSSINPGRAKKADGDGYTIGKALEEWSCTEESCPDTILVFINNSVNINTTLANAASGIEGSTASTDQETVVADNTDLAIRVANLETQVTEMLDKLSVTNLTVLGKTILGETFVNGGLNVGPNMSLNPDSNSIDSIQTLKLQSQRLAGVEFEDGLVTIDTSGNIKAKSIEAEKFQVAGASAGTGTIPAGAKSVFIESVAVSTNSLIFVTAKSTTNSPLSTSNNVNGSGFTVEIPSVTSKPIDFDWWIIEKK